MAEQKSQDKKQFSIIQIIGKICFYGLIGLAVLISSIYGYYHYFVHEITIGINNISDQEGIDVVSADDLTTDEVSEYEKRYFMEASYYSNDAENGIELQELKYNYFAGYGLTNEEYRATGMQYEGDFENYTTTVGSVHQVNNYVSDDFFYYDTTNGITWSGYLGQSSGIGTTLNRDEVLIIKIDDEAYGIQLTGSYMHGWWIFEHEIYYDYGTVFDAVFTAIKSNDQSYGDYYITLDLSQYFSIYKYNTDTGKFSEDDVSDIIKNYAVLKIHYDENGARSSSQSIFGVIECNSSYDLDSADIDPEYWQERIIYNLTEANFVNSVRYSEVYGGYFLSINIEMQELFTEMTRVEVNLVIKLQNDSDYNIVGIDYNGFENFKINSLTILGEPQTFYILEKGLYNTDLDTLSYSEGIIVEIAESAINSVYAEVIL